jgi:hypothetical protein
VELGRTEGACVHCTELSASSDHRHENVNVRERVWINLQRVVRQHDEVGELARLEAADSRLGCDYVLATEVARRERCRSRLSL